MEYETVLGNEGTSKPPQIFVEDVAGGGRSQENTLNREQIRKNCGNMGTQSNFLRKDGNTGQCQNGSVLSNLPRAYNSIEAQLKPGTNSSYRSYQRF